MYFYSKAVRKKIIHTEQCRYCGSITPTQLGSFSTIAEAYAAGFRLCKTCSPLASFFHSDESKAMEICIEKGLAVHLGKKYITITSPRSQWRIVADDNRNGTKLYHRNGLERRNESDFIPGYHDQGVCYKTLPEYLDYIVDHDSYRMKNPLYPNSHQKTPPVKGTKRYRKAIAKEKRKEKRMAVTNVLCLIDELFPKQATNTSI